MRRVAPCLTVVLWLMTLACPLAFAQRKPAATKAKPAAAAPAKPAASEETQRAELEEMARLAPSERVERLRAWIKANPKSAFLVRAQELLTSARAALGDERLRASDRAGGVQLFREAVAGAPASMSEELFYKVLAQLPANLFLLGEREAAIELARAVEERARGSASRLLSIAPFYLSTEQPDEAVRLASAAIELQPDLAAAHQALGAAHRVALRLDEAAAAYARALELDPKSAAARRSLADLRRATGKTEEALALYREQLAADPSDATARAGLVLALFDAGQRAEAERELEAALMEQAGNLPLLVGAAYWYAGRGEGQRALELSQRAVNLEPRYRWVWARLAHARALMAAGRPLEAEQFIRSARELGSFPTLDYELASALAAAGLYEEAAEELARSFTVRDGQLVTRLAGRVEKRAADFEELLAPERRASLFQFKGADSEAQTRQLKALLAFHLATRPEAVDADRAAEAAREFGAGDDAMRAYRNLYVAGRLLQRGASARAALERAEAAIPGVEPALDVSVAPFALFADEARELRARARELNTPVNAPEAPREQLSKFMRGRIEELAGWALFSEGQTAEAVLRLRRAVGVLPESSSWWRSAEWRLGAALEASGNPRDALAAYVKVFRAAPDPTRLAVIETLYKKLNNGSAEGLDALLGATVASTRRPPPQGPSSLPPAAEPAPTMTTPPAPTTSTPEPASSPTPEATPAPTPAPTPEPTPASVEPTPSPSPTTTEPTPAPEPSPSPTAEPVPTLTPPAEPVPTLTPEPTPTPATGPPATPPTPEPSPTPENPSAAATPEPSPTPAPPRPRRAAGGGTCTLSLSEPSISLKANGGSATVAVTAENFSGTGVPRINPSTANWADIIILAEARAAADSNVARFTVSSVSAKTGAFIVNFASPCGKQQLTVNVQ
jgi:tetratricopeptide (TPR) repeat protein